MTGYRVGVPAARRIFFFVTKARSPVRPTEAPGAVSSGKKRPEREDNHLLSNSEVYNAWSFTSTFLERIPGKMFI
jgi:hypothetical protein